MMPVFTRFFCPRQALVLAGMLIVSIPGVGFADPPLPGCMKHLMDTEPVCGGPGPNNAPTDGCCGNECSIDNDSDCCTHGDSVCLSAYGCNNTNDNDCCVDNDNSCDSAAGCTAENDSDCKTSGSGTPSKGGCSMAMASVPALGGLLFVFVLGAVGRVRRRQAR